MKLASTLAIAFAVASTASTIVHAADATRPPNIVFLLADDLGYGDVAAFGQTRIRTPNLDRLATQGIKLTTHYAGNAVCAPSRCTLLSSRHPGHAAVRDNKKPDDYALGEREGQIAVPPDYFTLPLTLKKLGYVTGGFGKWSEGSIASTGNPAKQGFDHFYGYICQSVAHNYYPTYLWDDGKQVALDNAPFVEGQPNEGFVGKQYSSELITEKAVQFVRDNKDRPFFLYVPTTLPHALLQVPEEDLKAYEGRFAEVPLLKPNGANGAHAPKATFAAMVTKMDRHFGQVLDELHAQGLDDDTIVIFTSDNGSPPGEYREFFNSGGPFRGSKGSIYEGGVREPAIVRWPGHVAPGSASDHVTAFEDWLPTLAALIGKPGDVPADVDGVSFAPTLLGQSQPERPALYRESPTAGGQQSVRVGNWKLLRKRIGFAGRSAAEVEAATPRPAGAAIARPDRRAPGAPEPTQQAAAGALELYDLATDLSEQHDVAADHPDVVARLSAYFASQHVPNPTFPIAALDGGPVQTSRAGNGD